MITPFLTTAVLAAQCQLPFPFSSLRRFAGGLEALPVLASALELLLAAVETSSDLDVADAVPGVLLSLAATLGTGDWIGAAEASVETGAELLRLDEAHYFRGHLPCRTSSAVARTPPDDL